MKDIYLQIFRKIKTLPRVHRVGVMPNAQFFGIWTHTNITDRQHTEVPIFENRKKCYITPPY